MTTLEFERLKNDAQLVVDYGRSSGQLPNDSLPVALATADAVVAPKEPPAALVLALTTSLNEAVKAIAPISLLDLREGRSPFNERRQRTTGLLQLGLSLTSILLILLVAFFSHLLGQETIAAKALREIQASHPLEQIEKAKQLLLKVGEGSNEAFDQFSRSLQDILDLDNQIHTAKNLAYLMNQRAAAIFHIFIPTPWDLMTPSPGEQSITPISQYYSAPQNKIQSNTGQNRPPSFYPILVQERNDESYFLLGVGLDSSMTGRDYDKSTLLYSLDAYISFMSTWLLPLLYGLLGGAVFCMRSLLDPRTPNAKLVTLIFRVCLGGIAGIVIAWFVGPPAKSASEFGLTMAPFGLAFLGGFSIDALFLILDRINRSLGEALGAKNA